METLVVSYFASPERASMQVIEDQLRTLGSDPFLGQLLDCFPEPAAILNAQRQIVCANDKLAEMLGRKRSDLLGMRPGEAVGCIHADEEPAGCGTSRFCRFCGAVQAITNSQANHAPETKECKIARRAPLSPAAMDLRVWASPIDVQGESFTVFAMRDTTDEKRREVLERVFYHDVLNTAGGLRGVLELWSDASGEGAEALIAHAQNLAGMVIDEIEAQRDLASAEQGDLKVSIREFDVEPLVVRLCLLYSSLAGAGGSIVEPPDFSGSTMIRSDELLLSRILGNLVKNAVEASTHGQKVRVRLVNSGVPTFHVHNESMIPEDVQLQIFQRSFTTKEGPGHGIGTYSVKLLTERYLKGWVTFSSSAHEGTTFSVTLPG